MRATVALTCFLVWLHAIPMDGAIVSSWVESWRIVLFLSPHVLVFLLMPRIPKTFLETCSRHAFWLLSLLTALFVFGNRAGIPLFLIMGIVSAPLVVTLLDNLAAESERRLWKVAGALVAANLVVMGLHDLPVDRMVKGGAVAALGFVGQRLVTPVLTAPRKTPSVSLLRHRLLLLVFFVTGGLLYASLAPVLGEAGADSRIYFVGYIVMVPVAVRLLANYRDAAVYLTVLLSVAGFSLHAAGVLWIQWCSMVLVQGAFGVADMLVIALAVGPACGWEERSRIMAAMCGGILVGSLLVELLGSGLFIPVLIANVALVCSLVAVTRLQIAELEARMTEAPEPENPLPPGYHARLSEMEREVLFLVLEGATYKEIAARLAIAEPTVKTYMQRMFQKFGCRNKRELLAGIEERRARTPRIPQA